MLVRFMPLLFIALPAAAPAQSMNAETFNRRALALSKKGPLALFAAGEIRALMREGQAAGARARDISKAAVAAGSKPRFCPASKIVSIDREDFMRRLGAIPAAERARIDMTEATTRVLAQKYPCSA